MSLEKLNTAFDEKPDEINIWKGTGDQPDVIMGKVSNLAVGQEYDTPYVVIETEEGSEHTVFLSTGLMNAFTRKKFIKDNDWINEDLVGQYIAFKFMGEEKNPKTKRTFRKYQVLWEQELVELGVVKKNE